MNKKLLKVLKWIWIIVCILIWFYIIYSVVTYCLYLYKFRDNWCLEIGWCKEICQRFKNDCVERVRADLGRGGRAMTMHDYYDVPKQECPDNCLRYTEERWYFMDPIEQDDYFKKNVDECEKRLKECREWNKDSIWGCFDYCDKYWKSVVMFN